jgi:hypothetical protein
MLIVHIPSAAHESGVSAIAHELTRAMGVVEDQHPRLAGRWLNYYGRRLWYENTPEAGSFIPDASLNVRGEPLLYVEVAFSQTWADLRAKVGRILTTEAPTSLLGILVMDISEEAKWSSPEMTSQANDFISQTDWASRFMNRALSFQFMRANGHIWMYNVNVKFSFFDKTWKDGDADPPTVRFLGLFTVIRRRS